MDKNDWLDLLARRTASWPTNRMLDISVWDGLADAITEAHEAEVDGLLSEVKAMREERDTAWEKADRLEARLAVTAHILTAYQIAHTREMHRHLPTSDSLQGCNCHICEEAEQALSTAPKEDENDTRSN